MNEFPFSQLPGNSDSFVSQYTTTDLLTASEHHRANRTPHDYLVDCAGHTIFWRELSLLERTLDKDVLALLVRQRKLCQIVVERQVVPVRMRLVLSLVVRRVSKI